MICCRRYLKIDSTVIAKKLLFVLSAIDSKSRHESLHFSMSLSANKRLRARPPPANLLRLADSEVHVIFRFLSVTEHLRLGMSCRQLHHACEQPASWQHVVLRNNVTGYS